jgi:hypothetical protein
MIRFSLLFASVAALFVSCASSPDLSRIDIPASGRCPALVTVSGSAEEGGTLNRAAPPAGIKRMKTEEARVLVAQYEADMNEYLAAGNYAAALDSFNKAADILASLKTEPESASTIRETMGTALKAVRVVQVSSPGDTVPGKAFSRSFAIKVTAERDGVETSLAGVPCAVRYPAYREDGSVEDGSADLVTDESGTASFTAPVPATSGKNTVSITANFPIRDAVLVEQLRQDGVDRALSVSFVHGVETVKKSIPTTIAILDYDKNGKPLLSYSQTATKLLRPLIQKGFSRIGMADFPRQIAAGDEEKLIAAARAQFGGGVQRFMYGTNRITSLEQGSDGQWTCTMSVELSVWDFVRNEKTYMTTITHTAVGSSEYAAMETARNELAGSLLVDDLRYNL